MAAFVALSEVELPVLVPVTVLALPTCPKLRIGTACELPMKNVPPIARPRAEVVLRERLLQTFLGQISVIKSGSL